jgi:hypothetical protein
MRLLAFACLLHMFRADGQPVDETPVAPLFEYDGPRVSNDQKHFHQALSEVLRVLASRSSQLTDLASRICMLLALVQKLEGPQPDSMVNEDDVQVKVLSCKCIFGLV